ncbi:thiolase family protein [Pseudalkalibacillus berkeleyi]|uniref:Thiolase family protein n=1 Tax=Pseudalkalibacillus berkeleyi TaxID=1069813 RepID=A0ABS9H058_9BACL|nr:thiolase family protein [Pseudalkalibacillus berkeleyi]MCF6138379.1 thiolase family protein [Pseudalkalibacillus berkeleyi]
MNDVFIVEAKRTPVGRIGGILKDIPPEQLAAELMKSMIEGVEIPADQVDEVILGNVVGPGGNLARLSSLIAGFPVEVPGVTVDRQCGSGLEAIHIGARTIQSGGADLIIAGGVESTSLAPWKMEKPSSLHALSGPKLFSRARFSPDNIGDPEMGVAAENVAEAYQISRVDQDRFALKSHQKAIESQKSGRFDAEIVPIQGIDQDECPRENTSLEKLNRLNPAFVEGGTVTAGNACPINDGASVVLLASRKKCLEFGLKPQIRFVDACSAGVDPNLLGIGPIPAVRKLLEKQQLRIKDIDLVEFNEAFASQVLASIRSLAIPEEKLNIGGGAIALGHPYGASGAILMTRLFHEMKHSQANTGLVTLGIGGGLGLATLLERQL